MRFEKSILLIAIFWYSLTAYFSIGYLHPDEHYQIIEFAGLIDETNTPNDLAWEYGAKIRSSFQPTITYFIFKICDVFSITNPYNKAFILRLIVGLFAVFTIYFFTNSVRKFIHPKFWKLFLIVSYFTWFLPFINVRFSSETLSGLIILWATSILFNEKKSTLKYAIIGAILGLSFIVRFQIAIICLSIVLWLLFIEKEKFKNVITLIAAGTFIVFLGGILDLWFYNEPQLVFWNYFKSNLIEGKASSFGVSPWYYYLTHSIIYSIPPIGILLVGSLGFFLYKNPKNLIFWIVFPFIIIHSLIPHKEIRFLFPIINLMPFIIVFSISKINWKSTLFFKYKKVNLLIAGILILINLVFLGIGNLNPAMLNSRVKITKEINEIAPSKKANLYYLNDSNPYKPWNLTTNFYNKSNIIINNLDNYSEPTVNRIKSDETIFLVVRKSDLNSQKVKTIISDYNLKEVCKGVPDFMNTLLEKFENKSDKILILFSN
ncbi:hypothetical protein R3X25_04990 [Lutibacter sp. TH_r2]|uniref:hypothetical protein n=1 Tax=Lutibacter sp. TH_r2 TaxID=3082083 RepID=UPI002952DA69|nr:hypothetical protein [Lutibacter sp. TH_r2]MDV7186629.1 hypothetical protein [Lutibacter sp. TH_r2]